MVVNVDNILSLISNSYVMHMIRGFVCILTMRLRFCFVCYIYIFFCYSTQNSMSVSFLFLCDTKQIIEKD